MARDATSRNPPTRSPLPARAALGRWVPWSGALVLALVMAVPAGASHVSGGFAAPPIAAAGPWPTSDGATGPGTSGPGPSGAAAAPAVNPVPTSVASTVDLIHNTVAAGNVRPTDLTFPETAPAVVPGSDVVVGSAAAGMDTFGEVFSFNVSNGSWAAVVSAAGYEATGSAYVPATNTVWTAAYGSSGQFTNLTIVDVAPLSFSTQVVGPPGGWAVAYDPDGQQVAVTSIATGTLWVYNATTLAERTVVVGRLPTSVGYDAPARALVVVNEYSDNLTVLNSSTLAVERSISVASGPTSVAFDAKGLAYVAQFNASAVAIVNVSSGTVTGSLPVGHNATSVAIDPAASLLYSTGSGPGNNLTVVDLSNGAAVASAAVGSGNHAVAVVPSEGRLVVANSLWSSYTLLGSADGSLVTTQILGAAPQAMAYDTNDSRLYFADYDSGAVGSLGPAATVGALQNARSVLSASGTEWAAYAGAKDLLWFGGLASPVATVLDGRTGAVAHSYNLNQPVGPLAYDDRDNRIYAANPYSNTVLPSDAGSGSSDPAVRVFPVPVSELYDPLNGYLYVGGGQVFNLVTSNIGVVNASQENVLTTLQGGAYISAFALNTVTDHVYAFNLFTNNVTVINGKTNVVSATFALSSGPGTDEASAAVFDPVTKLTYVAMANLDQVWLVNASSETVVQKINVGIAPEGIAYDYTGGFVAVANWGSGTVSILRDPARYSVTLTEHGLDPGVWWSVSAQAMTWATNGTSLTIYGQNGTLNWTVNPPGFSWSVTQNQTGASVLRGVNLTVNVTFVFSGPVVAVSFEERGLPFQAAWTVWLENTSRSSNGGSILYSVRPGTYHYRIPGIPGYTPVPGFGTVNATGVQVVVPVVWSETNYTVVFYETGLAPGTAWGFSLGGTLVAHSTNGTASLVAPNGTYHYSVLQVSGYTLTGGTGTLSVNGTGSVQQVTYTPIPAPPQGASSTGAFAYGAPLELGLLGLALVAILLGIVLLLREPRRSPSVRPSHPSEDDGAGEAPPAPPGPDAPPPPA